MKTFFFSNKSHTVTWSNIWTDQFSKTYMNKIQFVFTELFIFKGLPANYSKKGLAWLVPPIPRILFDETIWITTKFTKFFFLVSTSMLSRYKKEYICFLFHDMDSKGQRCLPMQLLQTNLSFNFVQFEHEIFFGITYGEYLKAKRLSIRALYSTRVGRLCVMLPNHQGTLELTSHFHSHGGVRWFRRCAKISIKRTFPANRAPQPRI